jgi:hypothetical protein
MSDLTDGALSTPKVRDLKKECLELIGMMPEQEQNDLILTALAMAKEIRQNEVERLQKRIIELKTLISQLP